MRKKRWIQEALGVHRHYVTEGGRRVLRIEAEHKGALHRMLGVPEDEKIPLSLLRQAAKAAGSLGRRARLALKLREYSERRG